MDEANNFGQWLKRRRRQLDLTQQQLADCAACSVVTIRKFENGERRPSRTLAELLAGCLGISLGEQDEFVAFARGLHHSFGVHEAEENRPPLAVGTSKLTISAPKSSLPVPPTPFVGRSAELAQIENLLADPDCRLLTLVGPGGMGKTRLALAAAATQTGRFADGIYFISLAAVSNPAQLSQTIAHHLGYMLTGAEEAATQVGRLLPDRQRLLVLDNFEQLLSEEEPQSTEILMAWISLAPQTKWLVTSRERLHIPQEWLLPVQGFAGAGPTIALFTQTARRVQPNFSIGGQEAVVAQICQYVGGMPLAIELAAGWTAILSCDQILSRMQQTFDFLSTSLRHVPQRHRSMRHLFDQTWQLLAPVEQNALLKLSVFRGGFALEEATAVVETNLPLLLALADKSLILADGYGRLAMHELMHRYAAVKLRESEQEEAVLEQHLQTFNALAEVAGRHLYGPEAVFWFNRLEAEHDNFRAALAWGATRGNNDGLLALSDRLWWFWFRRGYWREAEQWLATALAGPETADSAIRCRVMLNLSTVIALQGRYGEAAPYLMAAGEMAQRLEDPEALVAVLVVFGQAVPVFEEAMARFREAEMIWTQAGDLHKPWIPAHLYNLMGERFRESGRYAEAGACYRKSLALYRAMGNQDHIAYPLGNLGRLALHFGHLAEAAEMIGESVSLSRQMGQKQSVADWLISLAWVAIYQGQLALAEEYLQESRVTHQEMGNLRGQVESLTPLALLALEQGHISSAKQTLQSSFMVYQETLAQVSEAVATLSPANSLIVADFVDTLYIAGLVAAAQNEYKRTAVLFGIAGRLAGEIGHQPDLPLQQSIGAADAAIRQQLAPLELDAAWHTGRDWSVPEINQYALS